MGRSRQDKKYSQRLHSDMRAVEESMGMLPMRDMLEEVLQRNLACHDKKYVQFLEEKLRTLK